MSNVNKYIYAGNVNPTNSSVAFKFEDETIQLGETVILDDDQFGFLSQHFVLTPADGVVEEQIDEVEEAGESASTSDSVGTLGDKHKTASRSSKS